MRIWILHGPRDLRLEERSLPDVLPADAVRVRTDYTALSTGTDRSNFTGEEIIPGSPALPRPVGYSNAGTVIAVGSAASRFSVGQRIFSHQRHQSEFICPETDELLIPIPDAVSSESASMTYLYHLGLHSLRVGELSAGESVAVVGTGILGLAALSIASALGARTVALTDMDTRIQPALQVGAHRAWLSDDPDLAAKLADFTDGIGIDLVVLAANPWPAYRAAVECVRPGGRISVLSMLGRGESDPGFNPLSMQWLYAKCLTLKGVGVASAPYPYPMLDGTERFSVARGCRYLLHLMEDGTIKPTDLITHRFRFDQALAAYEMAARRDTGMIGTVFEW